MSRQSQWAVSALAASLTAGAGTGLGLQTDITTLLQRLNSISDDNIISDDERPQLKTWRATLAVDVAATQDRADSAGVSHAVLDAAWTDFTTNVDPVLAATGNTSIVKATWDGWWSAVTSAVTVLQGEVAYKNTEVVAATNLAMSGTGTLTVDSTAIATMKTLLLIGQTTKSENGIYQLLVTSASGSTTERSTAGVKTGTGTYVNDANTRDADLATYATLSSALSGSSTTSVTYSGFAGAGTAGNLEIKVEPFVDTDSGVNASAGVSYSTNGGSTWTEAEAYTPASSGARVITIPLTGVTQANLRVRVDARSVQKKVYEEGGGFSYITATSVVFIHDVRFSSTGSTSGWQITKLGDVKNGDSIFIAKGTTYGNKTYTATVASDNGISLSQKTGIMAEVLAAPAQLAVKAPVDSASLTGTPTAPTPATADNSTRIATTAWVKAQGYGGAGSAAWGNITGTLSAQTDLQAALNGKWTPGTALTATTGDFTGGIKTGYTTALPLAGAGSNLHLGYLSGTVTSTTDAFVAWASGASTPLNPSGINGSLVLAARNGGGGAEVVLAAGGVAQVRVSPTGTSMGALTADTGGAGNAVTVAATSLTSRKFGFGVNSSGGLSIKDLSAGVDRITIDSAGAVSMGALTATRVYGSSYTTAAILSNWSGANYLGFGSDGNTHKARIGMTSADGTWQAAPGDMLLQVDGSMDLLAGASNASLNLKNNVGTSGLTIQMDTVGDAYVWQRQNRPLYLGTNGTLALTIAANQAAVFSGPLKIKGAMWDFNANGVFYFGNTSGWLTWDATYAALESAAGKDLRLETSSSGKGIRIGQFGTVTINDEIFAATSYPVTRAKYSTDAAYLSTPNNFTGDPYQVNNHPGLLISEMQTSSTNSPSGGSYAGTLLHFADAGGQDVRTLFAVDSSGTDFKFNQSWGNGVWRGWKTVYHSGNIGTNAAAIQAAVASINAPMMGTHAQMVAFTPITGTTPYWYATDDTASDGKAGKLWQWNGSSWVATNAEASMIVGRITAGIISAGAVGAQALAADIVLGTTIRTTNATWGGPGSAFLQGGALMTAASGSAAGLYIGPSGARVSRTDGAADIVLDYAAVNLTKALAYMGTEKRRVYVGESTAAPNTDLVNIRCMDSRTNSSSQQVDFQLKIQPSSLSTDNLHGLLRAEVEYWYIAEGSPRKVDYITLHDPVEYDAAWNGTNNAIIVSWHTMFNQMVETNNISMHWIKLRLVNKHGFGPWRWFEPANNSNWRTPRTTDWYGNTNGSGGGGYRPPGTRD